MIATMRKLDSYYTTLLRIPSRDQSPRMYRGRDVTNLLLSLNLHKVIQPGPDRAYIQIHGLNKNVIYVTREKVIKVYLPNLKENINPSQIS